MAGPEHQHLDAHVDALVQAGNEIDQPWGQTKSGMYLVLRDSIDFDVARTVATAGMPIDLAESRDEIFCSHCWATIWGGQAAELSRAQSESWNRWKRDDGYTWADHALLDPHNGAFWYVDIGDPDDA